MEINPRIDKFLWAVRLFKTRSIASEECRKSHILINGKEVKSSKLVKSGDIIEIKEAPVIRTFKVISPIDIRISAKFVKDYIIEITPDSELRKLKEKKFNFMVLKSKRGRPTKKDRRLIDKFLGDQL